MNKQIAGSTEKRSSFFRRSSLNAVPVSSQRASTGNSAATLPATGTVTRTHRHEVSFGLPAEGPTVTSVDRQCELITTAGDASPNTTNRHLLTTVTTVAASTTSNTIDGCPSPSTSLPIPAADPTLTLVPTQVPTINCASFSLGLSTISERHSMEESMDSLLHPVDGDVSRTNSSCSMPDYLCHKLHSVTVNVPPPLGTAKTSTTLTANNVDGEGEQAHVKASRNMLGLNAPSTIAGSSSISRLVKESCESSASTTTSESYQLSDLPPLPARLATLSKPSTQVMLASALRSRKARHSIDVRALPSYLARKRQSTFGQFLTG